MPAAERADFLARREPLVKEKVADVLIRLTDERGLIAPDSSIWEHHWTLPHAYDGRRHYTYSSITAWRGLERYADLLEATGRDATDYREAAQRIRRGVQKHLVDEKGALAGSLEDLHHRPEQPRDAAVLEAVAWGMLDNPSPTMDAIFKELASKTPGSPGLMRNDDGNWYDRQEWLLLDLRAVEAWRTLGRQEKAEELLAWVTGWAQANYNALGELLDENGDFQGPFPMAGFGPGAFVIATTPD
jgi:GH15 family glucan-1,4-alpha-glucosidase